MKVTTDACLFGAWAAEEIKNDKLKTANALDIGAGTGLLSLMLAQKDTFVNIDAIEIDEDSCGQARENVSASPFADRVNVIHADAKKFQHRKKYDVIISNPPFYEKEIVPVDAQKRVAHHQAGLKLDELLTVIKENLSQHGTFYLLLPFKRNEEIKKILLRENLWVSKIVFVRQSTGHDYFRIMFAGTLNKPTGTETTIEEISICDERQQYTMEFRQLLKEYYLHL
jgi:tRNA1Val (adenine37-N6)-methyltransferase